MPRGRLEQRAVEGRGIADMLPQQLAAVDLGQERPLVERVDDEHFIVRPRGAECRPCGRERSAEEEVPREVHAGDAEAGAACDLEINDREADRNARPAVEHFVQKAVARVVVALAVTAEPLFVVEVLVERAHRVFEWRSDRARRCASRPPRPCGRADRGTAPPRAMGTRPSRSRAPPARDPRQAYSWPARARRQPAPHEAGDGGKQSQRSF